MVACDTLSFMESEKRIPVPSRMKPSVLRAFRRIAEAQERTLSDVIQRALQKYAAENDPAPEEKTARPSPDAKPRKR